jgi:hypothetical protein
MADHNPGLDTFKSHLEVLRLETGAVHHLDSSTKGLRL